MDQESGAAVAAAAAASGASFISLSEHEQMYFSGLHGLCQADASGKLSSSKVAELLKASQLPAEALHKVTEVCGAKHLGYFGTAQFYVALKLLAAAQSGLPVRLESVTASLPLPRFVGLKAESEMRYPAPPAGVEPQCGSTTAAATWSPADRSSFRHLEANPDRKEPWSPPRSPCSSPPRSPLTYRSYAHAKQRNGVEAQIPYESKASPRVKAPLEQLSFPAHYAGKASVEPPAAAQTCPSERDQQVTDECDSDPWRITEEQLEYYTNQFKTLQPDLDALILGGVAKNFFTKSKLPIPELSHIWELSDVNKDGALTFPEFCIAFHLIVARKNGYPLPESLPLTLQPGFLLHEEEIPDTPESAEPLIVFEDAESRPSQMDLSVKESPRKNGRKQGLEEDSGAQGGSSSSQGEQTLPSSHRPADAPPVSFRPEPPQDLDLHNRTRTRPRSHSSTSIEEAMKKAEEPPTPPPRPQKTHSRASSLDLNKLLQQGAPGVKSGWLLPPPALPPRPSASQVSHFTNVSEKPQSKVPQPNFADFSHFREEEESALKPEEPGLQSGFGLSTEDLTSTSKQDVSGTCHSQAPQKPVRRKLHTENQSSESLPPPAVAFPLQDKPVQRAQTKQKREIQMAIRKNRETNAVLTRLNSELQQQLKVVHQERVTLETQLELLRPMAST
ncbi:ralBP1-associated Eps domain-containing protein 2 isoform X2 [Oryzias melastigma]|uniref:ralBP1-associated Eps domain-containing protein 2 isoform X2 n=1 Tax=Oryzias melastigma TaxID=30732 RepID=UPI00168D0020|nr:ralBP1-associated Eps domain-containing protein 2 isoform X2 [Oryzias melastigma]